MALKSLQLAVASHAKKQTSDYEENLLQSWWFVYHFCLTASAISPLNKRTRMLSLSSLFLVYDEEYIEHWNLLHWKSVDTRISKLQTYIGLNIEIILKRWFLVYSWIFRWQESGKAKRSKSCITKFKIDAFRFISLVDSHIPYLAQILELDLNRCTQL